MKGAKEKEGRKRIKSKILIDHPLARKYRIRDVAATYLAIRQGRGYKELGQHRVSYYTLATVSRILLCVL